MIDVAIVEDEIEIREGLQIFISQSPGFICTEIYSSAELALENIPRSKSQVVLMDINLPGMSGIECTRQLKLKCPSLQIIMTTIYQDDENIFESLKAAPPDIG